MNTKEYTIKINGLDVSLKDVTKLNAALDALDAKAGKAAASPASGGTAKSSKDNTKGLTDEEKAAKRLEATKKKLTEVRSAENREQIEATQALREATRELTREIALNSQAEGSVIAMGISLNDLRNEYYELSEAERENAEIGGAMLIKIQALDKEYKQIKESAGQFQESVGNYEKALNGLEKLDKGLGSVGDNVNGLSTAFAGNNAMMGIFGSLSSGVEDTQKSLAKIIAIVTVAQAINTAVTGENSASKVLNSAVTKVQAIQENARTIATNLSTKSTIAATIAQRVFNAVAAANPYVLLALALVAVIGALVAFSDDTDEAAESQKKLNDQQEIWLDYLEGEEARLKLVSDARVKALERQLRVSQVNEKNLKQSRQLEDDIYKEKLFQNARLLGMYHREVESLEENRKKLEIYLNMIRELKLAEARGDSSIELDIDLNGKAEELDVSEALEIVQKNVNNLNKQIEIGVRLKTDEADLLAEPALRKALREKEDKEIAKKAAEDAKKRAEENKKKIDEARKNAQERAALELEAARAVEDLKLKLAGESLDSQRKIIKLEYERQQQDLRIRLKNDASLTAKEQKISVAARKEINAQIVNLNKVMAQELAKLDEEIAAKSLDTARLREDQEAALIKGTVDRRIKEIDYLYDRQIDDVNKRLRLEKNLTEQQRKDLNAMVSNYNLQRDKDTDALLLEGLNRRAALEIQTADNTLKEVQNRIGEVYARRKEGILEGVLDPKKTQENLKSINLALDQYVESLKKYQTNLAIAHNATLSGMQEGSDEYKEEVQKFAAANEDVNQKIRESQQKQKQNTKDYSQTVAQYYMELFGKIAQYASAGAQAVQAVVDTLNMGIQASLDSLNEQLETTNTHYDEAKEKREKYAEDVETIEDKVRSATGATADALRIQLQDAMHARDEAAREELRLAKEKEKLEAEIKKKEKQQKKNDLIGKIAMGIANTAMAITQALADFGPILGGALAIVVGLAGAAQVAIMSRQLSKLEKGGPIVGPSHSNGGVDIVIDGRPSYEAQGGEFMVNDKSYASNKALVEFINSSPDSVSLADLVNIGMGFGDVPAVASDVNGGNTDVVDAINGININPVVSVVDIQDVTNDVTTVRDLAGF